MEVQCILCDSLDHIDEASLYAKKLKNNYLKLHLCKKCNERIKQRTLARIETGKFRLFELKKDEKYI